MARLRKPLQRLPQPGLNRGKGPWPTPAVAAARHLGVILPAKLLSYAAFSRPQFSGVLSLQMLGAKVPAIWRARR